MYGRITNTNSLSIELCDTVRNGVYQASEATLANGAALGRELMERYHIPLENVYRHFDVTASTAPAILSPLTSGRNSRQDWRNRMCGINI